MDEIFWMWITAGILLILMEFAIPGFIIFFFGVGALLVALLEMFWDTSMEIQLLLFAVFGVLLLLICRKCFPKIFRGATGGEGIDVNSENITGAVAVVTSAIQPPLSGEIEFRGSYWKAVSDRPVAKGGAVRIVRRENLTMIVEAAVSGSPLNPAEETKENI